MKKSYGAACLLIACLTCMSAVSVADGLPVPKVLDVQVRRLGDPSKNLETAEARKADAAIAVYVTALESRVIAFWGRQGQSGAKGVLVAAVLEAHEKPYVKVEAIDGTLPDALIGSLVKDLATIPSASLDSGMFLIRIRFDLSGADAAPSTHASGGGK